MKNLGKCPFCDTGVVEVRKIHVDGNPLKLYACSNAHWEFVTDFAELSQDSTCRFRIFQNQLKKWHKKAISEREIRVLLEDSQVLVRLYSTRAKKEYFKWIIADEEYGLSVLWDLDVEEKLEKY